MSDKPILLHRKQIQRLLKESLPACRIEAEAKAEFNALLFEVFVKACASMRETGCKRIDSIDVKRAFAAFLGEKALKQRADLLEGGVAAVEGAVRELRQRLDKIRESELIA
jgi:histone H3/H4